MVIQDVLLQQTHISLGTLNPNKPAAVAGRDECDSSSEKPIARIMGCAAGDICHQHETSKIVGTYKRLGADLSLSVLLKRLRSVQYRHKVTPRPQGHTNLNLLHDLELVLQLLDDGLLLGDRGLLHRTRSHALIHALEPTSDCLSNAFISANVSSTLIFGWFLISCVRSPNRSVDRVSGAAKLVIRLQTTARHH